MMNLVSMALFAAIVIQLHCSLISFHVSFHYISFRSNYASFHSPDNVEMGKDLKIGIPRNSILQLQDPGEKRKKVLPDVADTDKDKFHELESKDDEKLENRPMDLNSNKPNDELDKEAVDLMSVIANNTDPHKKSMTFKIPSGLNELPETKDKAMCNKEIPSLELSLKRLRDTGDTDSNPQDQILRHSDLSAFSR